MFFTTAFRIAGLTCLALLAQADSARDSVQSLRRVATLREGRAVHTATALPSGQVLISGGMADGGGSIASVELFDPASNTLRQLGTLAERRASHTATLLADGRVLIAGGYDGEYLASVERFDPATRRFSPAGALVEGRSGPTATLMPDGRVLFAGGVGRGWTFLRSAELYDPRTGRSELVGSMRVPRESHTATLLRDGRVLIVGGHAGRRRDMEVYASAELYDPRRRVFEPAGTLVTARHKHDAIALPDGRVLVIGGADRTDRVYFATTEIYDPRNGAFATGPPMANRRYKIAGTSILLPGGDVLVTSGAEVAERLDVRRMTFREVPGRFPAAFRFAAVAPLPAGEVFIAGGYSDENRNTNGIWRFGTHSPRRNP